MMTVLVDAFGIEWSDEYPELEAVREAIGDATPLLATRHWHPWTGSPLAVIAAGEVPDGGVIDGVVAGLERAGWVVSRKHMHETLRVPGGTVSGHWHVAAVYGPPDGDGQGASPASR